MNLCKKYVKGFLHDCPDARELAVKFWDRNFKKVKGFYKDIHKENDVVLSASFGFLLRPVMERIGVSNLVCSELDFETGDVERLCFREYKKDLFLERYKDVPIDNFYTDSLNDMPIIQLSKKAYLVKGETIKEYKPKRG